MYQNIHSENGMLVEMLSIDICAITIKTCAIIYTNNDFFTYIYILTSLASYLFCKRGSLEKL